MTLTGTITGIIMGNIENVTGNVSQIPVEGIIICNMGNTQYDKREYDEMKME